MLQQSTQCLWQWEKMWTSHGLIPTSSTGVWRGIPSPVFSILPFSGPHCQP